ncbi:MAG: DNA helicase RecG, partial [Elusimicrobia bacterium]|nr:DNA helicase RecG [Elusimicrobiota bacterium]
HALIQEAVEFQDLGLAVIDEQQRFGVRQRGQFQQKSLAPHILIMTATPIPRTLALTLYGDLAVSTIDQIPPGRPRLATHWTTEAVALASVRKAVKEGRQAYIVFPLVDESDKLDLRAAVKEWERLKARVFPGFSVGLLHGRMKPQEKENVMATFVRGETQVLVATPVIEVGIDVPNASVIVIMHAERFGLSLLHLLRGRVGRGNHPSVCSLVSESQSPEPAHRLRFLCGTLDGFKLAEEDLNLRGPGEFLGEAQHGIPLLKVGNLVKDGPLIAEAREAAFKMIQDDPRLEKPQNQPFRAELHTRFAHRLIFGQVA